VPAAAPEGDLWAGYKGTYAAGANPDASDTKSDAKPETKSVASAETKSDTKPSARAESKTASAADAKPKATSKSASNDAKSMYGIAGDAKTEDLTPDAPAAAPSKRPMKKRAGAVGGKKTVAKKAAKR
jgi:hypothetical protein